eukprot:c7904_g1_i1.p1 GENE.c7904_g1_i1~~c7904_g1_i1.p1  ORF type:complete len:675 (-),score=226.01 c7904_g1_i1:408-2432(-)
MSAPVPGLKLPQNKLDKLADDLRKLELATAVVNTVTKTAVPAFQRQGYLEKLGHTRSKWFKRFFVLRDSFLLSYNLSKSDLTVEPRSSIHLGNATIELQQESGKEFCFLITTMQRDKFQFAAESEQERRAWVHDLEQARKITHANMIKMAVENKCLAEEKGAVNIVLDNSTSALAIFSNEQYIQNTPITGGAEGWLRTLGFNPDEAKRASFLKNKKIAEKQFFILRDSHLLMFNGGDMLTKPRGVMFLLTSRVEVLNDEDTDSDFPFRICSPQFGDEIVLIASSNKMRKRWVEGVRVGARVTYPDYSLLKKEHQLLASVTLTPRAAPPPKANQPASVHQVEPVAEPMIYEDYDILGQQLDPATQQAFDSTGMPIVRNPEGKLVTAHGEEVAPSTPRYNTTGQQLDPFNRPLPPGAVPMFTAEGTPIGVGPDGKHYLPDGTVIEEQHPHFDADGNQLHQDTIVAANAVATDLNVALKVRTMLKSDGAKEEAVDVLGRTFRDMDADGKLVNADGIEVPMQSARRIETSSGQLVDYKPAEMQEPKEGELHIKATDDTGDEKELGVVTIDDKTTLRDVRRRIETDMKPHFEDFVFLINFIPLLKYEENDRLAVSTLPEIFVRGNELKKVQPKVFTNKVNSMMKYETEKKKEAEEFTDVLARIRQGKFLRNANLSLLEQ